MASVALELSGITKRYPGVVALDHVDFECRAGEIHAVLGENGSGKSTLLGIAGGAITSDAGHVTIMGNDLTAADPLLARRRGLAIVYQDDSLVRELSVAENLLLGAGDGATSVAGQHAWAKQVLAPYELDIAPDMQVGQLTPAQRQFLEIVKALTANPRVLLLDEPTASLDVSGVDKLSSILRRVTAEGTAVVYVSHRLPEILALANRVTILRDGVGQGTYEVNDTLSETDLIALMVGRPIETEYPQHGGAVAGAPALTVTNLGGRSFRDLSFELHSGEILGFAGAEGNGQREAIRTLGGLESGSGVITCDGTAATFFNPADALAAGILSVSADRSEEFVFPALGVRENMTVQVLNDFSAYGLVSSGRELVRAQALAGELNIVAPTLEQPINHLSGGNQQKAVLARAFLRQPRVVLIDEPTQGVDANARFDIYRAVRAMVDGGAGCIVNSSDAMELAGICDRVLVFSRGRVIRELQRADIGEEAIVSAFLRSTEVTGSHAAQRQWGGQLRALLHRLASGGGAQWWVPLLFLTVLMLIMVTYAAGQTDVFLTELNIRHILLATAPLALVTMAQLNVLMVRGFDISVGSLMSFTVVLASFLLGAEADATEVVAGLTICLAAGGAVGGVNGALVRGVGINPVITTIATLSVLQGIALYLRPSPGGAINPDFMDLLALQISGVPVSFFVILAAAIGGDMWLYRTRSGLRLRAVGFREQAARRNGVHIHFVHMRAYLMSALLAVCAGFFLSSEVGVGHPVIGQGYTLTSIAAAVLGGAALNGGRGSFIGALVGALFFTTSVNIITLLGLNTGAGVITSGALTLFAVFLVFRLAAAGTLARTCTACPTRCHGGRALNTPTPTPPQRQVPAEPSGRRVQMRFVAIWVAILMLIGVCAVIVPRSLLPSTFLATVPLAAFLAIAAIGETLVLMSRGIDLSTPAVVTLASTLILGVSRGDESEIWLAVGAALSGAVLIGLLNGLFVAVLQLNALIVTLAVGAITSGVTLWYRQSLPAELRVPPGMAAWGGSRILGFNVSVWVAAILVIVLTILLRKTALGRRFVAVGANPRAAWVAGINVSLYQTAAFTIAALLYGIAGVLLSAFIRNPTLKVGDPYLLAPIAAAVLGGTAISGGIGSMVAVAGAALFLTQLSQSLKMLGLSTAFQFIIYGTAIALGMTLSETKLSLRRLLRRPSGGSSPL